MAERRRTFAPVVALGLASGTLTAVASNHSWISIDSGGDQDPGAVGSVLRLTTDTKLPLALALSLVVLAAWGVLLVTRGVVRRAMAVLGLVAALGVVVTVVVGHQTLPDDLRHDLLQGGAGLDLSLDYTAWFWVAAVTSLVSVAATALAVRYVRDWPEMGNKYDAPGAAAPVEEPESGLDMWKALDEGRDPTE